MAEGERRQVTVAFSDLSGYTAMSEKLDPEEVKQITSRIFGLSAQVVAKYDGHVDKLIGDAIMSVFGMPQSHEDDPVRAIKATLEIHEIVRQVAPGLRDRTGTDLEMHSGINTGLVVTGEADSFGGTDKVIGDTVNVAARLADLASSGEIIIGDETFNQAERYFTFETQVQAAVKGKAEPLKAYRLLGARQTPALVHRISGLRSEFIGRRNELSRLLGAIESVQIGHRRVFAILGDAGTGKSRLIKEFRNRLDLEKIQWYEGRTFSYCKNIPYFPLIDLLSRAWMINEDDSPQEVRGKVESGLVELGMEKGNAIPVLGSLFGLSYPDLQDMDPEFWRSRLFGAVKWALEALSRRAPTVICLEDLHWADPSSIDLLRFVLADKVCSALFLCISRDPLDLFTGHPEDLPDEFEELRLGNLSRPEALDMTKSLLRTSEVPSKLKHFVQEHAEGNPLYLEESVNSLIESGLLKETTGWQLVRPINEVEVPPTVNGIISSRLDRLPEDAQRVIKGAAVIGRDSPYDILKKISDLPKEQFDECLKTLEQLDLITKSSDSYPEYSFKHALTHDVVYGTILKTERQALHERIARVLEQDSADRLPELYETLAMHFKHGQSTTKAADYLAKSGEKSLARYALEEAHGYFNDAYSLLLEKADRTSDEQALLIEVLNRWALVYEYKGDYKGLGELLGSNVDRAESLGDNTILGMFYAWTGLALWGREKFKESRDNLLLALRLGEEHDDKKLIGYACMWLIWTCIELGLIEQAIAFGHRAQEMCEFLPSDNYLFFYSLCGLVEAHWVIGQVKQNSELAATLFDYASKHSDIRASVAGYIGKGHSHSTAGDFPSAIECYKHAIEESADPSYRYWSTFHVGFSCLANEQMEEAGQAFRAVIEYSDRFGCEILGTPAKACLGLIMISQGHMSKGYKMMCMAQQSFINSGRKFSNAYIEYLFARLYSLIAQNSEPMDAATIIKNLPFLIKHVPNAGRKAEAHFAEVLRIADEVGAFGIKGLASLDLGLLYKSRGQISKARECISKAANLFDEYGAERYLKQANDSLASLAQ